MNVDIKTAEDKIYRILIVDDNEDVLDVMQLILKNANQFKSDITTVLDGKSAIAEIERQEYDLVLTDYKLPGMNGIDLLAWVKTRHPNTGRILITGYPSINVTKDAINKANVHYYLEKPWDNDELKLNIYETLKKESDIELGKMPYIDFGKSSIDELSERESENKEKFKNLDPPPRREAENELGDVIGVDNAKDALRMLDRFEKDIHTQGMRKSSKKTMMFEFGSISEFNNFSFEIEKRENARIKDVRIFENKYIISVSVYPSTFHLVT